MSQRQERVGWDEGERDVLCERIFQKVGREWTAEVLSLTTSNDFVVRVVFVAVFSGDEVSNGRHGAFLARDPDGILEVVKVGVLGILAPRRLLVVRVEMRLHLVLVSLRRIVLSI